MDQQTVETMEQEIVALDLTAPRINLDHVMQMLEEVEYKIHRVEGTNTTQAVATFRGFTLGTGETHCVSDDNFNAALGIKYAIENAKNIARAKLYELEGWKLFCSLQTAPNQKSKRRELTAEEQASMAEYQSHKRVHATPMTRGDYNLYRGWQIPADENPADIGYLVIYNRGTEDHYESWSPDKQFVEGYQLV